MNSLRNLSEANRAKLRFLVAGASTTAFSYLLYLLLLLVVAPKPAFAIAYVAGIAWSYTACTLWVFRQPWRWRGLVAFPLVYLVQGVASYLLFLLFIDRMEISPLLAPILTTVVLLPVTFVVSRAVVGRTADRPTLDRGLR